MRGLDLPVADLPIVIIPGGPLLRNPGGRALLDALGMAGAEGPYPAGACDLLVVGGGPRRWPPASRPRRRPAARGPRRHRPQHRPAQHAVQASAFATVKYPDNAGYQLVSFENVLGLP